MKGNSENGLDIGLTHAEVDVRRKEHGYNEVAEKKGHPVLKFLGKFWGISAWMLELIMVLSAVLGNYSDLAVVGALLVVKTYFGRITELVQEARPKLHIEAVVARIVRWLFVIVSALLGMVVVLSLIRGVPLIEMVRSCSSCS